jgi:hypothetical protein
MDLTAGILKVDPWESCIKMHDINNKCAPNHSHNINAANIESSHLFNMLCI